MIIDTTKKTVCVDENTPIENILELINSLKGDYKEYVIVPTEKNVFTPVYPMNPWTTPVYPWVYPLTVTF